MSETPTASVILINWNGIHHTIPCLESLRAQTYRDFEIVVVDNGSTDGCKERIKEEFPEVRLLELDRNYGFTANNHGFRASQGRYLVVLNNDTVVEPDFLAELVEPADADPGVGMVAGKILLQGSDRVIDSVGVNIYPDGMSKQRGRLEQDAGQYDDDTEVLFPSGCCSLLRRKMIDEIGGYDDDFFAYCEDTDLGLRARLAGWRAVLAPRAVVHHAYSGVLGAFSLRKAFLVERNHMWVLLKNLPVSMVLASPWWTAKRYLLQAVATVTRRGTSGGFVSEGGKPHQLLWVLIRAYWSVLRTLPCTLGKRRELRVTQRLDSSEFKELCRRFGTTAKDIAFR